MRVCVRAMLRIAIMCLAVSVPTQAQNLPEAVVHYADIVLYNGKVHTVDRNDANYTVAEAVAIRDDRILAVGPNDKTLALAGPRTVRIDLKGRTVTPGFIDTHSHIQEYALNHIPPAVRAQNGFFRLPINDVKQKDLALKELEAFAKQRKEGAWVVVGTSNDMVRSFTLEEMDRAVPRNPMYINGTPSFGALNSRAFEILSKTYPDVAGIEVDAAGRRTGQVKSPVMGILDMELIPDIARDVRVDAYKKEADAWVGAGVTTVSTRMFGEQIAGYLEMNRRGTMIHRLGYSDNWLWDNPLWLSYVRRLSDTVGIGSDLMWSMGVSITSVDSPVGTNCVSIKMNRPPPGAGSPLGDCHALPGSQRYEAMKEALRRGIRVAGVHAAGDRGIDVMLDMFLELQREGVPLERLRPNLDHCSMVSRANIDKARQIRGMTFSCAPKYIFGNTPSQVAKIWDEEVANQWVVPTKSLLNAGLKVVWEVDAGETTSMGLPIYHPMLQMQALVTRADNRGTVWGAQEAIDRRTALLTMTRWGAEYVLREDRLGSIEAGKLADLVLFDGDWLTVADDQLVSLPILMTIVGGKVVYSDPDFAGTVGSQLDSVLHPHAARYPAYRPKAGQGSSAGR